MVSDVLGYMVFGLIAGFAEILPVSASACESLTALLMGLPEAPLVNLMVHLGVLGAVLLRCGRRMVYIYRELFNARLPARRRRRSPDTKAVRDGRVILGGILPMAAVAVVCWIYRDRLAGLPAMTGLLILTGVLVYIPQHFPGGNRTSRGMARVDTLLLGLAAGIGKLPGMSRMGSLLCSGLLRGCDREYLLELALLITAPALAVLGILDILSLFVIGLGSVSFWIVLAGILAAAAAFAGAFGAVSVMRYLAVRVGFSGFAYFSWGLAMFTFILYLMT